MSSHHSRALSSDSNCTDGGYTSGQPRDSGPVGRGLDTISRTSNGSNNIYNNISFKEIEESLLLVYPWPKISQELPNCTKPRLVIHAPDQPLTFNLVVPKIVERFHLRTAHPSDLIHIQLPGQTMDKVTIETPRNASMEAIDADLCHLLDSGRLTRFASKLVVLLSIKASPPTYIRLIQETCRSAEKLRIVMVPGLDMKAIIRTFAVPNHYGLWLATTVKHVEIDARILSKPEVEELRPAATVTAETRTRLHSAFTISILGH
ncbi:hypothetical protein PIIN_06918 [Serendipita indica DSM 11827]|uniref:Uncharacterized protein n=1 Tax=Serendipita indica (strain DSM 11827) TaxID=1109443 RepID=G4TNS5_SERID|nr:hypothetical protein PIIN_06918 [Serendipita indica DSM 11827]